MASLILRSKCIWPTLRFRKLRSFRSNGNTLGHFGFKSGYNLIHQFIYHVFTLDSNSLLSRTVFLWMTSRRCSSSSSLLVAVAEAVAATEDGIAAAVAAVIPGTPLSQVSHRTSSAGGWWDCPRSTILPPPAGPPPRPLEAAEGLPSVLAPLLTSLASVEKPESTTLEDPSGLFRTVRAFGPRERVAFHEPGVSSETWRNKVGFLC